MRQERVQRRTRSSRARRRHLSAAHVGAPAGAGGSDAAAAADRLLAQIDAALADAGPTEAEAAAA